MSDVIDKPAKNDEEYFVVDRVYLRKQARDAATLFLTPVSGVYRAAVGRKRRKPKKAV